MSLFSNYITVVGFGRVQNSLAKTFVYKQCFCYLNVKNVKQKNSLFHQAIVLWWAY